MTAPRISHPSATPDAANTPAVGGLTGMALGLAVVVVATEYLARRVVAPSLPVVGAPVVNDMLAAAVAYGLLVTVVTPSPLRSPAGLGEALRGVARQMIRWLPWLGGVLFLVGVLAVAPLDAWLWGDVRLPGFTAPASSIVLFASAGPLLATVSLLLVNGVVIPLAEERLWRGSIQPNLRLACGVIPGLLATAVLFSLKHAIVDGSLGRLLALTVGGLVLGLVAYRASTAAGVRTGWQASAVSHMVGNLVATGVALAYGAI